MKKVLQLSDDISSKLDTLRKQYFGVGATSASYRDSFVVNEAIERFSSDVEDLLTDEIAAKDSGSRTAKSISFRSECFEKVNDLAVLTDLSYAEVVRRLIIFSIEQINRSSKPAQDARLTSLKQKLLVAVRYLEQSTTALNSILEEIEALEENEEGTVE